MRDRIHHITSYFLFVLLLPLVAVAMVSLLLFPEVGRWVFVGVSTASFLAAMVRGAT